MADSLVLVLDFGSDYLPQLVERLRDSQVNYMLRPGSLGSDDILALQPDRIIIAGTPGCAEEGELCSPGCDPMKLGLPTQCIR
ncbi:MAG TPA: hypothetical protein VNI58_06780 [Mariprofundaceae bacterium]|nr:hypothetical protein [Mariprofundaceae bacterium]